MDLDETLRRLEETLIVTTRIQEGSSAALASHKEWLEELTLAAVQHERGMADHELRMAAIDERLEQITIKLDRIAELIFKDRSSNGHET